MKMNSISFIFLLALLNLALGDTCTNPYCNNCPLGPNQCQGCTFGARYSGSDCIACTTKNCGLCDASDVCVACLANFAFDSSSASCSACPDGTRSGDYYNLPDCIACDQSGASMCRRCSSKLAGACTECMPGGYLSAGYCATCDTGCNVCTGAGACTECAEGYELSDGTCVIPCSVDNCETCDSGSTTTCAVCSGEYFLSNGACEVLSDASNVALESTIRYDMTMTDYDTAGGNTFFIEQTATQLEVDQSVVTITSVKEGSVIIKFKVKSRGNTAADLKALKAKLDTAVSSNGMKIFGGAGILNYESGFVTLTVTGSGSSSGDDKKANVGAILGGVLGGTALLIVVVLIAYKKGWLASLNSSPKSATKYDLAKSTPTSPDVKTIQTEAQV